MEFERKFLVEADRLISAINLNNYERYNLEQAYISTEDSEVRIRKIKSDFSDYNCYMTIKTKGNLSRKEVEFEISYVKYQELVELNMYKGNIISKVRYKIPLENGLIAELDVYGKELVGLITVEIEFGTEEEANTFQKPDWFGEDVTSDKKYKNRNQRGEEGEY